MGILVLVLKNRIMEKEKLTLSAIFIATYTTLIFTIPKVISPDTSTLNSIIYYIFLSAGLAIDLMFFLYISFYAFEVSSLKELPFVDVKVSKEQAEKIKNRFFNYGVHLIFFSITSSISGLVSFLQNIFNTWVTFVIYLVIFVVTCALVRWFIHRLGK